MEVICQIPVLEIIGEGRRANPNPPNPNPNTIFTPLSAPGLTRTRRGKGHARSETSSAQKFPCLPE